MCRVHSRSRKDVDQAFDLRFNLYGFEMSSCPTRNFFLLWHWHILFGTWVYFYETMCQIHLRSSYDVDLLPQGQIYRVFDMRVTAFFFLSFVKVIHVKNFVQECFPIAWCVKYTHDLCMTFTFDLNIKINFTFTLNVSGQNRLSFLTTTAVAQWVTALASQGNTSRDWPKS